MTKIDFKSLHQQKTPLLLCNVWDVASAKVAENLGFIAIGTSSAAIAKMLGYQDGEYMAFEELLFVVKRIVASSQLPLTVDIESGFSDDPTITAEFVKILSDAGVVGINIEDSWVDKASGERQLKNANDFAIYLNKIKACLKKHEIDIFLNVRTDTYLLALSDAGKETQKRAKLYQSAGADGLFVPCVEQDEAIQAVVNNNEMPINVMCMPNLADFEQLKRLGVKRISMGNFLFDNLQDELARKLREIKQSNSFKSLFFSP